MSDNLKPSRTSAAEVHRNFRALFWMVGIALLIRVIVMLCFYDQHLHPAKDYWFFAFEEGDVAQSVAQGHGFGNPLGVLTGPTAWFAPVYPYFMAGVFSLFGVFSKTSCLVILSFQALFSALTCLPIFYFSKRMFTRGAALAAGWVWVFYPYAVYWPVHRIWDTWFATLLLAILFLMTLKMQESASLKLWMGFGLLAGFTALTDTVVLAVLPLLALWSLWRLYQKHRQTGESPRAARRFLTPAAAAVVCVTLVITPWCIRNYRAFHQFIPIRDDLSLEMHVGNNGDSSHPMSIPGGPWVSWMNPVEFDEYTKMGEIAYFRYKGEEAREYIRAHPRWYGEQILRRIVYTWTGFWSTDEGYLIEQSYDPVAIALLSLLTVLMALGLSRAFRKSFATGAPFAIVLIFLPLVYYMTHVGRWYRCPMGPMIIALAAFEVHSWAAHLRRRAVKELSASQPVEISGQRTSETASAPLPH